MSRAEDTRERILAAAEALTLKQGFAAMSLADLVAETGLTKGAFFHHFKGKGDLAKVLVARFARMDYELFEGFSERADELAEDSLQSVLLFFKLFEDYMSQPAGAPDGCVFASFLYERDQFDSEVHQAVEEGLRTWTKIFESKFDALLNDRTPRLTITAGELAEMAGVLIEGGFVYGRAYGDPQLLVRQCRQFRNYLKLLFQIDEA